MSQHLFGTTRRKLSKKERSEVDKVAAIMPINSVGGVKGNVATLWNAATYLVDRKADGKARECRGGADRLDSLLFGSRGERLTEVQDIIENILDGGAAFFDDVRAKQAANAKVKVAS